MIDVNVHLSRWPFRRLPDDETPALVARLRAAGVTQAWAGNFDALLHRDLTAVNDRTAAECAAFPDLLWPVASLNPALPDWESDLQRAVERHGMRVMRLYPNYHGYGLDDPRFAAVLDAAIGLRLIVQLVVLMEDERTQSPWVRVPPVNLQPLPELLAGRGGLRLMLLNAFPVLRGETLERLMSRDNLACDIATLEGMQGLSRLLNQVPYERVMFGSHAPFFIHRSAVLKLHESELPEPVRQAIVADNARRWQSA